MPRKSECLIFAACVIAAALFFNIAGCAARESVNGNQTEASQQPVPKRITTSELKNLRWIEGTWRGTGDGQQPFFERYHFENDSTLVVESFSDETLSKVTETARYELKDGQFGNSGDGPRWVATKFDNDSITFEPVARARNQFRWERQSNDVWKAVLTWPASQNNPAKQKVYQMERVPQAKQ
ncbi:MAG: hypothetical protein ICV60_23760 [Pyrinomonadaceae bacterium]|nr:hypothetical protein [Pyrinomonadaceae bacterium]